MTTNLKDSAPTAGSNEIELSSEIGGISPFTEADQTTPAAKEDNKPQDDFHPGFRLWVIIGGLAVTTLLAALENTVVTVAAPVILTDLKLGNNFIWITNAFFLCRFVFLSKLFNLIISLSLRC